MQCPNEFTTQWPFIYLGECISNSTQLLGLYLGFLSILFWMVALLPQIYNNYRSKSTVGLSFHFLLLWFSGDTLNLLGCLIVSVLPSMTLLAIYFVFIDILLISQYFYYRRKLSDYTRVRTELSPTIPSRATSSAGHKALIVTACCLLFVTAIAAFDGSDLPDLPDALPIPDPMEPFPPPPSDSDSLFLGHVIAWLSTILYLTSRVPQIYHNYCRKSIQGLSMGLFACAILGNLTYSLSILFKSSGKPEGLEFKYVPFLIGSLGTLAFDGVIFYQSKMYHVVTSSASPSILGNGEAHDHTV